MITSLLVGSGQSKPSHFTFTHSGYDRMALGKNTLYYRTGGAQRYIVGNLLKIYFTFTSIGEWTLVKLYDLYAN